MDVLAVQFSVIVCGVTPVPDKVTVAGELEALLVTVTLAPETAPVADGANVTVSVTTCPGVIICPLEIPLALKPAPVTLTEDTVIFEVPALVNVTF